MFLQSPGDVDVSSLIKKIVNGLVVLFFIGLPILRGLRESRRQKQAQQRAPEPTPSARPTFEELLRGDAPNEPPAPPPIPQPGASRVPAAGSLVDLEGSAQPMMSEENLESEAGTDEEALAEEAIERREREEFERQQETARRQRDEASSQRASVEPAYAEGVDLAAAQRELPRPDRFARARIPRGDLARAFVMSEILGPPLGLDVLGERRGTRPLSM